MMKQKLSLLVEKAIQELGFPPVPVIFETPKQKGHGDFATNAVFLLAKETKKNPSVLAQGLIQKMEPLPDWIEKVEVAGPGFLNFSIRAKAFFKTLADVLKQGKKYGENRAGKGKKVILEFVSANPTGPLNIVSARSAAIGDTLANILKAVGFRPTREFYVNDVGVQIDLFAESIEARYRQAMGEEAVLPEEGYQGEYLREFAQDLAKKKRRCHPRASGDPRVTVDSCFRRNDRLTLKEFRKIGLEAMIAWQKKSLKNFGVAFDNWYRQSDLVGSPPFLKSIARLQKKNCLYEKEGALFFQSTSLGDDKDRVVKKQDGEYSYFASDIAYHDGKFQRGFDWVIDILGPDHHGYVARTKAAVEALGYDPKNLTILIVQQVNLVKGDEILKMSKRAGRIITMDDLIEEVGKDVARYFFLQRSANAHLDFDLELAKKETPDNPVFYIQYAHARIASIFKKAEENKIRFHPKKVSLEFLDLPEEKELAKEVLRYPEVVSRSAEDLEAHGLAFYCLELAKQFQAYYSQAKNDSNYRVVDPSQGERTNAKLYLLKNIQIVLQNALRLMGISAPERMESKVDVAGPLQ